MPVSGAPYMIHAGGRRGLGRRSAYVLYLLWSQCLQGLLVLRNGWLCTGSRGDMMVENNNIRLARNGRGRLQHVHSCLRCRGTLGAAATAEAARRYAPSLVGSHSGQSRCDMSDAAACSVVSRRGLATVVSHVDAANRKCGKEGRVAVDLITVHITYDFTQ
jgi:hypothetical protein